MGTRRRWGFAPSPDRDRSPSWRVRWPHGRRPAPPRPARAPALPRAAGGVEPGPGEVAAPSARRHRPGAVAERFCMQAPRRPCALTSRSSAPAARAVASALGKRSWTDEVQAGQAHRLHGPGHRADVAGMRGPRPAPLEPPRERNESPRNRHPILSVPATLLRDPTFRVGRLRERRSPDGSSSRHRLGSHRYTWPRLAGSASRPMHPLLNIAVRAARSRRVT